MFLVYGQSLLTGQSHQRSSRYRRFGTVRRYVRQRTVRIRRKEDAEQGQTSG
jgi:hypothetical protein